MRLTILALLACASLAGAQQAQPRKPNVVFILADDLGWKELGCYGQKKIRTPSIDRLASEGMKFTQFYSGSPVCAPSRCVLMTGMHTGHAHVRNNKAVRPEGQHPLPAGCVTLARLLKENGYKTGCVGKWGLGPPGSDGDPLKQGFDFFFGYNCQSHAHNHYPTYLRKNNDKVMLEGNTNGLTGKHFSHDLMEREALAFIEENSKRPFFLYVPFTIPHLALQVPEDSLNEYKGKWEDPPYKGGKGYLPHPHPRAAYAAMVTRMDRSVGRIMDLLKKLKLEEETIVFFSSDNGPTYDRLGGSDSAFFESAGGLRGFKGSVYEGGIRVPLIVRWPGRIKAGTTTDLVGAFQDILPTVCAATGTKPPGDIDGISLLPTLTGKGEQAKREYLYWEFPAYGSQQAVRLGNWKGVRQNMSKGRLQIELYDLAKDPNETTDVAGKHPQVVAKIEAIMKKEHVPSKDFPLPSIDKPLK